MGGLQSVVYGFNAGVGSVAAAEVAKDAATKSQCEVIVIAVDRSKHAENAFEWYCKHIHCPTDEVHVVHCLEIEPPNLPAFAVTASKFAESIENAKNAANSLTANYERYLKDFQINGQVHSELGKPGEVVINSVEKYNATQIVMGTRGFGIIRRTMLGSVSQYVLHHTKVPVTIVPKKETSRFF